MSHLALHRRPCDVYNAFVDPRDIMVRPCRSPVTSAPSRSHTSCALPLLQRYTRARAECKLEVGGVYSVFDGAIQGAAWRRSASLRRALTRVLRCSMNTGPCVQASS